MPEIQGLRTIALLLVATFHIWTDRISGGVDVFLLISAYLMTRSLTDRAERGIRTNALDFATKKFARLLPASATTIILTLIAILAILPANAWPGFAKEAIASLFYFENIQLQANATNYFAANESLASPFQHFWSLSIQGQVFLAWAILHVVSEWISLATNTPIRKTLSILFTLIFATSLTWSIWLTINNQVLAYFDTFARAWEFAAGSLFALIQPRLKFARSVKATLTTIGTIGVVSCGFVLPVGSSFPGFIALWPVLSAGAVILGSTAGTAPAGLGRLLAHPTLARIGGYTYALYLTHWPVLVLSLAWINSAESTWAHGLLVLLISAAFAVAIVNFVEKPAARFSSSREVKTTRSDTRSEGNFSIESKKSSTRMRQIATIAVTTITASSAAFGTLWIVQFQQETALERIHNADYSTLGANASPKEQFPTLLQDPAIVKDDWITPGPDCTDDDPYRTGLCYNITPIDGNKTERQILNIGNSHSTQFTGAILETVERQPTWALRTQVAPGCNLKFADNDKASADCKNVWKQAARFIAEEKPDIVFVYGTWWAPSDAGDLTFKNLPGWIEEQKQASPNTTFVVVRDNPRLEVSPFDCAQSNSFDDPACSQRFKNPDHTEFRNELERRGVVWVDVNNIICPEGLCQPAQGGVITYLDDNHLTASYARTLAGPVARIIHSHVEWWPEDAYHGTYQKRTPDRGIQEDLNS